MIKFLDLQKITKSFEPQLSEAISRVLKRGWFLLGEEVEAFESEYANYIGSHNCIGVGNGLDALRLILRGYIELGVMREGDEVIVPANTFIASILAITENRLKPIFVEPDPSTYNLDISKIEEYISSRTKAILIVHLYGFACWTNELKHFKEKYNLIIIEDNAQASGALVVGDCYSKRTGSLGDAAGHSFYPGKNLGALGDGGAVTTDDRDLANLIRSIANYGSTRKYKHSSKGLNSRLDEIQATVLRIKLKRLDVDNQRRRAIAGFYNKNINHPDIVLPFKSNKNIEVSMLYAHVWHLFVIRIIDRKQLQKYLKGLNIQTLIHYPLPVHLQTAYKEWNHLERPVTERLAKEVLSLPISQVMTQTEAEIVVDAINSF